MATLITGAAGQVGVNLTEHFLKKGKRVIAVDNFITGSEKNFSHLQNSPNLEFSRVDIETLTIDEPLAEIYHLACPTGVPNLEIIPEEMITASVDGTKNLLEIAKKQKIPLLLTSSSEVYGAPEVTPQSEEYTGNVSTTGPRGPYEEGKRIAETLVATFARKHGVNAKIVRIFNTFGPYFSEKDLRVVPQLLMQAMRGEPLTVHGDGSQIRTFLYVDDLIAGITTVMAKGEAGTAYNVGSDIQLSVQGLAEKIIEITGSKSRITYLERPSHDHNSRQPDLSRIRALGWQQSVSLEEGLKLTAAYISQQVLQDPSA